MFLFGANKIPQWARSIGQARKEIQQAASGQVPDSLVARNAAPTSNPDPLVQAAQKEGIDTTGKTRDQIASELSSKLNNR